MLNPAPLSHSFCYPIEGDIAIGAGVVGLLKFSRPTAIVGCVVAVVVLAVQGVFGAWSRTHVGVEVFKGVHPAVANPDAPTSISVVSLILGLDNPGLHATPNKIFCALRHTMGSASCPHGSSATGASTTNGVSSCQVGSQNRGFIPALALTNPVSESAFCRVANRNEIAESMTSNIYRGWHNKSQQGNQLLCAS